MDTPPLQTEPSPPRWHQFSLRELLSLPVLCAAVFALERSNATAMLVVPLVAIVFSSAVAVRAELAGWSPVLPAVITGALAGAAVAVFRCVVAIHAQAKGGPYDAWDYVISPLWGRDPYSLPPHTVVCGALGALVAVAPYVRRIGRKLMGRPGAKVRWRLPLLAALMVAACAARMAAAQPESEAERTAARNALRKLHSPVAAERAEAVKRLRDRPAAEALKLIVPARLADAAAEVRLAAYDTLLTWKTDPDATRLLLKTLQRDWHGKKTEPAAIVGLVAVLLAAEDADTQHDLAKFLDGPAAAGGPGLGLLLTVADELGNRGDAQSAASLARLAKLKCVASVFARRRAVVQALVRIRQPEAVDALLALLPDLDGEVLGDAVRHLTAISGQTNGIDKKAWKEWWKKSRDDFVFPPPPKEGTAGEVAAGGQLPTYYGITVYAKRIVFVIDISGSMEGPRITAAKRELMSAIDGLPAGASFGIVAFSKRVGVWQRGLVPATPAAKQGARQYVYGLRPGGETATYDALETAFRMDPEAIYLLSDGAPNAGTDPSAPILATVGLDNRARRVSIYTIGVAPGQPGSDLDSFMRLLAARNFGQYRRVEQ